MEIMNRQKKIIRANEIQESLNNRSSERVIEDTVTKIAIPKNISSISSFDGNDLV